MFPFKPKSQRRQLETDSWRIVIRSVYFVATAVAQSHGQTVT